MEERLVDLIGVHKNYGKTEVLRDVSLFIRKNEFVTLLGPSGCGKTTTLRIIGGFEKLTSGELLFDGKNISKLPPYKRKINTVFQTYALFTHLNVKDNVAFGLEMKKVDKKTIDSRVSSLLDMVALNGFEDRPIASLSGGQQQRVAIARALAADPMLLLLDEPLGALDLKERKRMQIELKNLQRQLGISFLYVTHDQEEALTLSDIIAVMNNGTIQQIDTPEMVYNEPKNAFVAGFIGESNIIDGVMSADMSVRFSNTLFGCLDKNFGTNEPVDVVIRPEDIELTTTSEGHLSGVVEDVEFTGAHYVMLVKSKSDGYVWKVASTDMFQTGSDVGIVIEPDAIHVMKKVIA